MGGGSIFYVLNDLHYHFFIFAPIKERMFCSFRTFEKNRTFFFNSWELKNKQKKNRKEWNNFFQIKTGKITARTEHSF